MTGWAGGAVFTIVCPMHYDHELENDNSIGLRLVYKDTSFLICGDASRESEEEMLRSGETLKSDVYMASHHGSRSSNSWRFLKGVDPEAVVISAGYGNPYGHPVKTVMKRIQRLGADLYRTDLQGDRTAVSDGEKITWNVNSGAYELPHRRPGTGCVTPAWPAPGDFGPLLNFSGICAKLTFKSIW